MSRAALEERNRLAPQMADYDRIAEHWVPYLMSFHHADVRLPSVTTDAHGFRTTFGRDGVPLDGDAFRSGEGGRGIVLGSSAAFGVGASGDGTHLASLLNRATDLHWYNYGGRAFNSTQELLLLTLFPPRRLDELVVLSGINNLTLAYLSPSTSPWYNSFFKQSTFTHAMEDPPGEYIGVRRATSRLIRELRHRFLSGSATTVKRDISAQYKDVLACFRRDLQVLSRLAEGWGCRVSFVLQPLASWIAKELTDEERRIFRILDEVQGDWQVLAHYLGSQGDRYRSDVRAVCEEVGVTFTDLNDGDVFAGAEWLFVDRVHLTDRGYERVAAAVRERLPSATLS